MSMSVKESLAMAESVMDMEDKYEIAKFLMRLERKAESDGADKMADEILKAWQEMREALSPTVATT